ncbi:MAG TPA: hypothetical protein VKG62_00010 [Solirubrobacteraceae bacterium]|nr:hypothetical protein [Solirubrobacteraceae bacterium]
MVRRRIAAGIAVVVLIVVVLVINGCLKSQKVQSLKDYNRSVSALGQESVTQVATPLFGTLTDAGAKPEVSVLDQVNSQRMVAQDIANRAKGLSVPGEMSSAQRNLLLALNLRTEAMTRIAELLPHVLGGKQAQASAEMAGEMEAFLASDVIYSQRVAPLIQEVLASNGVHGAGTAPSAFLPNLGWLETSTLVSRVTGQPTGSSQAAVAPGTHGSALVSTSVGTNTLAPEPTLNHVAGGGSPTFTVIVENTGSNVETNVKVDMTVTAAGKQYKASRVVNSTQPGSKVNVEIPVTGIPLGAASKIEAYVEPVPGEEDTENNKGTYLAIFGE